MAFHRYSAMPSDDDKDAGEEPTSQTRWSPNKMLLWGYLLLLLLFTGGGFGLGQHLQVCPNAPPPKDGFYTAYSVLRPFDLNLTYAKKPTNATDQAWLDLYPTNFGIVTDKGLGIQFGGISAFHSLHCVDMFRRTYHNVPGSTNMAPEHIEHCIEYLRQGVMCAADGTLEHGNLDTKVVDVEGVVHHCGDYDALVKWSEERPFVPPTS